MLTYGLTVQEDTEFNITKEIELLLLMKLDLSYIFGEKLPEVQPQECVYEILAISGLVGPIIIKLEVLQYFTGRIHLKT